MPDTKLLQIILDGQTSIREDVANVRKDIKQIKVELDNKIDTAENRLTQRLNKIGSQLAYLEDDAPTREEHDKLEKRVAKLEQSLCS